MSFKDLACALSYLFVASAASADDLTVMSWNIANLASGPGVDLRGYSRSEADYVSLRSTVTKLAPDIVALQEIGSMPGARAVLGDSYEIHFETRCVTNDKHCEGDSDDIYTAIAFKRSVASSVEVFQIDELAIHHQDDCGRTRPVRGGVGVKIAIDGRVTWVPSVHMKATCKDDTIEPGTEDDCATQRAQYKILNDWIAARPEGDTVIVAGDMNRELLDKNDSIRREFFDSAIDDVNFLPEESERSCWGDYRFDFRDLERQARANNPVFDAERIKPWIYTLNSEEQPLYRLLCCHESRGLVQA